LERKNPPIQMPPPPPPAPLSWHFCGSNGQIRGFDTSSSFMLHLALQLSLVPCPATSKG
jgi:hypothetical protein